MLSNINEQMKRIIVVLAMAKGLAPLGYIFLYTGIKEPLKILEEMKTDKSLSVEDKKEAFINFKNGLENPEQLIADYDFHMNSQPASEGKSQGGWSQTPATPLKK